MFRAASYVIVVSLGLAAPVMAQDAKAMTVKTKAARKPEMKAYTLPKEEVDGLVTYLSGMKKK